MYPVTKFFSGIAICFLASLNCYANDRNYIEENNVEITWYEAKNNYNRIFSESVKARHNEVACEQKLDYCDKNIKSAYYYPKALAAAKARLEVAEKRLYDEISSELNTYNNDLKMD